MSSTAAATRLADEFRRRTPNSQKLSEEAQATFPGGVTHDARIFDPYSLYIERADGSRKWDVDGNEYVDYFGGHGALLLGHNHPSIVAAIEENLTRGTHFGASHTSELRWAQLVQQMVPSAERVRFTSSGTEATLLALRLARAFTGKPKIVRFVTHFHGWHDHVAFGVGSHFDGTPSPGVLPEIAENILLCPPNDEEQVAQLLQRDDVAAVMLEPTGATWGHVPTPPAFLHRLRELTAEQNTLLIFDEVVSGFRCSAGGAQAAFDVTPDVTTLAKILAGGLPGAAVVGRREIMDLLDHRAAPARGWEKITHHGTFNANPLSSVAGIAALETILRDDACRLANDYAAQLREGLREVVREAGLNWCVYGTFSSFHVFTNPDGDDVSVELLESGQYPYQKIKAAQKTELPKALRLAMLNHGVDIMPWPGGPTSAVHSADDLEQTIAAFRASLHDLR